MPQPPAPVLSTSGVFLDLGPEATERNVSERGLPGPVGGEMNGGRAAETGSIPASARRMIQSLKEIVNCPDQEIYAALRDCGMDPDEAISRLLHQDTFQEVKNKRDKKKEVKEFLDSKSRGIINTSSRGGRNGADRGARVGSNNSSFSDSGISRGKAPPKREISSNIIQSSSILGPGISENLINRLPAFSRTPCVDTLTQVVSVADASSSPLNISTGPQHAWSGVPGQISLAEIVKRGRPPSNPSGRPAAVTEATNMFHNRDAVSTSILTEKQYATFPSFSEVEETNSATISEHISPSEQSIDHPPLDSNTAALSDSSALPKIHGDGLDLQFGSQVDESNPVDVTINIKSAEVDSIGSEVCCRQVHIANSGGGSSLDDLSSTNLNSLHSQWHTLEHREAESAKEEMPSFTAGFQRLSLNEEGFDGVHVDTKPAVIIPNHLQVTNAECSQLSFGSFRSGGNASFGSSLVSTTAKSDSEPASIPIDIPSVDDSPIGDSEYYGGGHLKSSSELIDETNPRVSTVSGDHNISSSFKSVVVGADSSSPTHGHQYIISPSLGPYEFQEPITQRANLDPVVNARETYTDSSLEVAAHSSRNLDIPYSTLPAPQSMPARYGNTTSSINGPTTSIAETLKPYNFSISQHASPALASSSIPSAPTLPQHLAVHPYSQPTLPLGHFSNMIGYPFLPSNYAYLASASFQQAYPSSTAYHQSPVALQNAGIKYPPQYKSSDSVSSMPQSAAAPSNFGGFGNSANTPGSFFHNSPSASRSTYGYDDNLQTQYKEANHFASSQQNENSPMWIHGASSRTMSSPQASAYYNLQGQSQLSGLRQSQQQPSHYGSLGYPSSYYTKADISQELQHNRTDGNLGNSQGLPSQSSSHRMWQNNY